MRLSVATTLSLLSLLSVLMLASRPARARVEPFPPAFKTETIAAKGTKLYVRVGGTDCSSPIFWRNSLDPWRDTTARQAR